MRHPVDMISINPKQSSHLKGTERLFILEPSKSDRGPGTLIEVALNNVF